MREGGGKGVGTGQGLSTGSRPSSLRPGHSASGKAKGSAVSHFSAPSKSPGAPIPSLTSPTGRRLVLGCSCVWGAPGSPPGASFRDEEIIEDNSDPYPRSLKLRKESLDPGDAGPPPTPAAEGTAFLTPTLSGAR